MFMTKKLVVVDSNFSGNSFEFDAIGTSNKYLTERFELYSQHDKYLFSHNTGCSIAKKQVGHDIIFLRQNKNNIIHIIQMLKEFSNEWKHINDKRLALWNILTYKEE